jgi:hypothetical protein
MVIVANRTNGVLISETTVPASSPLRAGRTYASTVGAVNTGLAISNPNDEPAVLSFFLTTASGSTIAEGTTTIAPYAQIARFLDEQPFGVPKGHTGGFTFRSSVPVSAIALRGYTNERSEFLMSTLPVVDLDAPLGSTAAVMAQFADGGGWTTEAILINTTDSVQSGRLEFVSGSTFGVAQIPYSIRPRSTFVYRTNGSGSTPHTGYVRVIPAMGSSTPASVSIFGYVSQGVRVTEASVPAVAASSTFRIYPEAEGLFNQSFPDTMGVGIAIANLSDTPTTVRFEATTSDGFPRRFLTHPSDNRITIPAGGHVSIPLHQVERYRGGVNEGVLRVTAENGLISMVAFRTRYNERGDYLISTLPPAREGSASNTALFFPHIVQGGGYTSEIILFGAQPLKSSEGVIRYFNQAGAPLPPRFEN